MLWRRCFSIFPHIFPMFYWTFFTIEEWKNFPFSRFCEIEEQNVCSWCWFLSIGISGGQPLEYSRQKDKAPVVVLEGGPCVWSRVVVPGKMQVSVVAFPCLVSRWVKFPSSRSCEIEEQNVGSWCWFLALGSLGASLLNILDKKIKPPWLFSRGGEVAIPGIQGALDLD